MQRQGGIAWMVGLYDLLLIRQPSEDRRTVIDPDRRHVVVLEQLLLVVAHHDQRVQPRRRHIVAQPRHRRHRLAVSSRQLLGRDPLRRIRRRARQQRIVVARVAVEIDELPRLVAGQEAGLPVLDPRGEHRAVRCTECGDQLSHCRFLLATSWCGDGRAVNQWAPSSRSAWTTSDPGPYSRPERNVPR